MINRLKKIRSLSVAEIKNRSSQYLLRNAENLGLTSNSRELSDSDLFSNLQGVHIEGPAKLHVHFRDRTSERFFPSLSQHDATISEISKLPGEADRLIAAADKIVSGKFDLLGFSDLSFGAPTPDWHFEPISGLRSPLVHWSRIPEVDARTAGDKKIVWELNRHQYFIKLGQAYWLTRDEKYAQEFVLHLQDWMDKNPPKRGVNWLSSLEVSFRSMSWIWAFYFFRESPSFSPEVFLRMLKFLYLNGKHIERYLSTYYSPNTHLTGEALGLYILGKCFPEFKDADRWKELGKNILIGALDFQVRPDGTYCEQSSHYLRYTIDFYCAFLILARKSDSPGLAKLEERLNALFDCLLFTSFPNGEMSNFGDDDGGRLHALDNLKVTDIRPTFAVGAVLLDRSDLKLAAGDSLSELLWLVGPSGLAKFTALKAEQPDQTKKAFFSGGFFTARSDWSDRADAIVIDCGPHGFMNGGHAHADALSFVLAIDGCPIFIDSGTYTYSTSLNERDLYRATGSHNCLTVGKESSSIPNGPFSWKATAESRVLEWGAFEDGWRFRGTHNGYDRIGVTYEREIVIKPNFEVSINEIIECEEPKIFEVNFILAPGLSAEILEDAHGVFIYDRTEARSIILETVVRGETTPKICWKLNDWFPSLVYGQKVRSLKLVLTITGEGRLMISNSIHKTSGKVAEPSVIK